MLVAGLWLERVQESRLLVDGLRDLFLRLAQVLHEDPMLFHERQQNIDSNDVQAANCHGRREAPPLEDRLQCFRHFLPAHVFNVTTAVVAVPAA